MLEMHVCSNKVQPGYYFTDDYENFIVIYPDGSSDFMGGTDDDFEHREPGITWVRPSEFVGPL